VAASKKKQPIEKGVTYDDIFQHYYVEEVKDWCKAHNLKSSGKKSELIKRILDYLDGGKEGLVSASARERGRKRKHSEDEGEDKAEKKNGKKQKTSKKSKKSKDEEKEEEKDSGDEKGSD